MNICVFYYDGFCEFEVVFAVNGFRDNIFSAALENRVYVSEEKQKYLPDKTIHELNPEDIDLFIIPGGNPEKLYEKTELKELISRLNENNKHVYEKVVIVDEDVVRDGNCITSIGQAFIEFAIELHKVMNIYKNEEEVKDNYNWLKNIKVKK